MQAAVAWSRFVLASSGRRPNSKGGLNLQLHLDFFLVWRWKGSKNLDLTPATNGSSRAARRQSEGEELWPCRPTRKSLNHSLERNEPCPSLLAAAKRRYSKARRSAGHSLSFQPGAQDEAKPSRSRITAVSLLESRSMACDSGTYGRSFVRGWNRRSNKSSTRSPGFTLVSGST